MSKVNYNVRTNLNPETSHYTGSVACVDVEDVINQGKFTNRYTFVEIADCHGKVRIHKDPNLEMKDFLTKLRLLSFELSAFANFLEKEG